MTFSAASRAALAPLAACAAASAVALRPAAAERLRRSATWLANVSSAEASILLSCAATS